MISELYIVVVGSVIALGQVPYTMYGNLRIDSRDCQHIFIFCQHIRNYIEVRISGGAGFYAEVKMKTLRMNA